MSNKKYDWWLDKAKEEFRDAPFNEALRMHERLQRIRPLVDAIKNTSKSPIPDPPTVTELESRASILMLGVNRKTVILVVEALKMWQKNMEKS